VSAENGRHDATRQRHTCEVCRRHGVWDKSAWRWIFAPSEVDGKFPTKFCSQACEDEWFRRWDETLKVY
jgi:hypothetical protein